MKFLHIFLVLLVCLSFTLSKKVTKKGAPVTQAPAPVTQSPTQAPDDDDDTVKVSDDDDDDSESKRKWVKKSKRGGKKKQNRGEKNLKEERMEMEDGEVKRNIETTMIATMMITPTGAAAMMTMTAMTIQAL